MEDAGDDPEYERRMAQIERDKLAATLESVRAFCFHAAFTGTRMHVMAVTYVGWMRCRRRFVKALILARKRHCKLGLIMAMSLECMLDSCKAEY